MGRKYDFAGWVTKNDIRCSDGVIIKHDAFKENHGQKVPLVWNHDYKGPDSILGHMTLEHRDKGVYGYGFFNDTPAGQNAKKLVTHGDVSSMSIGARKIKRSNDNVIHGSIYEVSLVLAAANPGAMIETVIAHSDSNDEECIIYPGTLIHSADDILEDDKEEKIIRHSDEQTIQEVIDTMTEEQQDAVYALLGMVAGDEDDDYDDEDYDDEEVGGEEMKHNVFNSGKNNNEEYLRHGLEEAISQAIVGKASSLKDVLAGMEVQGSDGSVIQHGINSIEMLFPEAMHSTNGNQPIMYKDPNTAYEAILSAVTKTPFSRIKTLVADLTEEEARAKGYIKGSMKKEEFFSLIKRTTTPTTIYKKQKLDRDDIVDITDFDVVKFMNAEMRIMIREEIARAILVGDGRSIDDDDKINEDNIRPVISDHDFFTIKKSYANAAAFLESAIKARKEYRGSGQPSMYIDPELLADVLLVKAQDGRYIFGDIPTVQALAAKLRVKEIVETSFMVGKGAIIVNLTDYALGATKGGELTNFDDFDIDFNQYKYLIETRLSGALTMPKSAIHLNPGSAATGADDVKGGMTFGQRQADKTPTGE